MQRLVTTNRQRGAQSRSPQRPSSASPPRQATRAGATKLARTRHAFTLLEALIASVVVAMVAAAASMSVAVGIAVQEGNRLSVIAMHAAELQMSTAMETSYETLGSVAGTEATGQLLAPARPGSSVRPLLPSAFSQLSRITTVTAENRTFSQYNSYVVEGKRVTVTVFGPDGAQLAQLVRFRGKEPGS